MSETSKPNIVISACLLEEHPQMQQPECVQRLRPFVNFLPVCPEKVINHTQDNIHAELVDGEFFLKNALGEDYTSSIRTYAQQILSELVSVDGFLLKHSSPSCGISDVPVMASHKKMNTYQLGSGLFGSMVRQKFNGLAVEDELSLADYSTWDFFLTKVFTFARFRQAKQQEKVAALVHFHRHHKLLLLAYNQQHYRICGPIVANRVLQHPKIIFQNYQQELEIILSQKPKRPSIINSLQHIFGYFSKNLSEKEKRLILHLFEKYRNNEIPLTSLNDLLWRYVLRFNQHYLQQQVFFQPYPKALRRKEWQHVQTENLV